MVGVGDGCGGIRVQQDECVGDLGGEVAEREQDDVQFLPVAGALSHGVVSGDLVESAVEVSSSALDGSVGEEVAQERWAQACGDGPEVGESVMPEEGPAFVEE